MSFLTRQPCINPKCQGLHGVKAVKRRHAAYTGPDVSPLRSSGDDPASAPPAGSSPEQPHGSSTASPDVLTR
jgi:hypothetical protein